VIGLEDVRQAMGLTLKDPAIAQGRMVPGSRQYYPPKPENVRQAGVLALLHPNEMRQLCVVLTRRTETLRGHSGQISFPGGKRDESDASFLETALRETCEELSFCDENIEILGTLTTIYIPPSNFEVHPFVGAVDFVPQFVPSPAEVAEVFSVPLSDLMDERNCQEEYRDFQGQRVLIPYYAFGRHKVWGATAILLSELAYRLQWVLR
jgi:8-oxo-dGTP pyrophosphatase MutT (NUDIX family)